MIEKEKGKSEREGKRCLREKRIEEWMECVSVLSSSFVPYIQQTATDSMKTMKSTGMVVPYESSNITM